MLESNWEMVGPVLSTNRIGWPPWSLTKALSTRLRALASWLLGVEGMNKTVSGVWSPAVVVEARSGEPAEVGQVRAVGGFLLALGAEAEGGACQGRGGAPSR